MGQATRPDGSKLGRLVRALLLAGSAAVVGEVASWSVHGDWWVSLLFTFVALAGLQVRRWGTWAAAVRRAMARTAALSYPAGVRVFLGACAAMAWLVALLTARALDAGVGPIVAAGTVYLLAGVVLTMETPGRWRSAAGRVGWWTSAVLVAGMLLAITAAAVTSRPAALIAIWTVPGVGGVIAALDLWDLRGQR